MPTYVSKCPECGHQQDYIRKVADMEDTPEHCGLKMIRQGAWAVTPMIGAMTFTGHAGFNTVDGKAWIEDGASLKKYMKQNDLISATEGKQEAAHAQKNKAIADKQARKKAVQKAMEMHAGR